jgi:hypothetical protein
MPECDQDLREELLALAEADQRLRRGWSHLDQRGRHAAIEEEHLRAARLAEIVAHQGWPGTSVVGEDGSSAAWLIVQHADHDVDFQERALVLLNSAVARGEARASDAALLTDRVCVNRGRPQVYGSQFSGHGDSYDPRPIADPDTLEERRASVGLEPFAAYERRMRTVDAHEGSPRATTD